jgi:ATP-dependent Lon protease
MEKKAKKKDETPPPPPVLEPSEIPTDNQEEVEIPEELAILPLKEIVIFPFMVVPLMVGRESSIRLVDEALLAKRIIGLVAQKDNNVEQPGPDDIYRFGTAGLIHRMIKMPDGNVRILVQGLSRVRFAEFTSTTPYLKAKAEEVKETKKGGTVIEAMHRKILDLFNKIVTLSPNLPEEAYVAAMNIDDDSKLTDFIASNVNLAIADRQALLEELDVPKRMELLLGHLQHEVELLELGQKITTDTRTELEKGQREYFLRQQLRSIQKELGETDEQTQEIEELRKSLEAKALPEETREAAMRELDRLEKMPPQAAEYTVSRTYLDWILNLPWLESTTDSLNITDTRKILDEDHYDLEKVKERILEYLSVLKLKSDMKGPILCFVGPPGVGKTSLGRSIARALGRKFIRISLGGIHDEAEVRGHRRTYVGALPGRIIQGIRNAGSNNPVFMMDEIDKVGMDFRGDPTSALLEVLDPEQNFSFRDHYLEVPFDLSTVMFITTANLIEPIQPALRDRMEIISLPGYSPSDKLQIAKIHLVKKQLTEHGLKKKNIVFADSALEKIVLDYTREAGVRNLEREIAQICRKTAVKVVEDPKYHASITARNLHEFLGPAKMFREDRMTKPEVGVATGLAVTEVGGEILFIEATAMEGRGNMILTGSLGDVMKESAQAAMSYVRANSDHLKVPSSFFEKHDIHIHVPAGATPKDGPSAGVTMAVALASLVSGHKVDNTFCMTGEVTLRGKVLPVGGIREKLLAAIRNRIPNAMIPLANKNDFEEMPEEHRSKIKVTYIETIDQAWKLVLLPKQIAEKKK